jgi:hypothetical protein
LGKVGRFISFGTIFAERESSSYENLLLLTGRGPHLLNSGQSFIADIQYHVVVEPPEFDNNENINETKSYTNLSTNYTNFHEKMALHHEKIVLQHEKIVLQHEKIVLQHEKIILHCKNITFSGKNIILLHNKNISLHDRNCYL